MNDPIRDRWDAWFFDEMSYNLDINYMPWLDRYKHLLPSGRFGQALDLGCGRGFDTKFLMNSGLDCFAADNSWGALQSTRKTDPSSRLIQFDMRGGFPFQDERFSVIISNLTLHYYSTIDTASIITEMKRIMLPDGWLIARVNSTSDSSFQQVKEELHLKIEEDYFKYHGIPRRFFREPSIRDMFSDGWQIGNLEEKKVTRYEKPKVIWEFAVQKI